MKEVWENTIVADGICGVWSASWSAFTHLLSRQQIHSADGDKLGDVCTATIFPGRVSVDAVMLPEEASRLSVVVNECELRLRPLPAPLLRAASHNHRLLLMLLPSSWHADDLCQSALMGFVRATGGLQTAITYTAVLWRNNSMALNYLMAIRH